MTDSTPRKQEGEAEPAKQQVELVATSALMDNQGLKEDAQSLTGQTVGTL